MRATLLDDKLTKLTPLEAIRALREGYRRVVGRYPSAATLAVHVAQSALESGRWKSMHWHNFSNVKAGQSYEGFYSQYRCNEIIKGKTEWFNPPHPQCNFRAYLTAADGAEAHMRFLQANKRYALAWAEAERGDPDATVLALKRAGFFTASVEPYRKATNSLFREFLRVIQDSDLEDAPPLPPEEPTHSPMSDDDMAEKLPLVYDDIKGLQALTASEMLDDSAEARRKAVQDAVLRVGDGLTDDDD
jgi:hypothetical protein